MLIVKTRLGPSAVHGLGVFAGEPIAQGQPLWRNVRALDSVLTVAEVEALPEHARAVYLHYGYRSLTLPTHYILEFDNARFMNHAGEPNTWFAEEEFGYATRDIAVGDEITCDYREFCLPEDIGFLR